MVGKLICLEWIYQIIVLEALCLFLNKFGELTQNGSGQHLEADGKH
jgi:hypothetical protein